jgi:hypothetical protein
LITSKLIASGLLWVLASSAEASELARHDGASYHLPDRTHAGSEDLERRRVR